jgi:hypothetical protein
MTNLLARQHIELIHDFFFNYQILNFISCLPKNLPFSSYEAIEPSESIQLEHKIVKYVTSATPVVLSTEQEPPVGG